jgi:hypothetical protein
MIRHVKNSNANAFYNFIIDIHPLTLTLSPMGERAGVRGSPKTIGREADRQKKRDVFG